jgi:hypothetical protein
MRIHTPPIPLTRNGKQVKRPDLLAYNSNSRFAIEAKGYSGRSGDMNKHKNQSQTGGIRVNFTVASVAYDLYNQVKCKYYDPYNDNTLYDNELLSKLTKNYYSGLLEFLNKKFFDYREVEFQGERFYEVDLSYFFERSFHGEYPLKYFYHFDCYRPRLILPKDIKNFAEKGITNELKSFLFDEKEQSDNIYIDNDMVGLKVI